MKQKVCIVTTLCDSEKTIDFFVQYHLRIGFVHLYLFIDKLDELPYYQHLATDDVTIIPYDNNLIKLWLGTKYVKNHFKFINKEVMARQSLNTDVAISLAQKAGFDWILHIDSDELFYLDKDFADVSQYFHAKRKFDHITFINHEAIPEQVNITNFFEEVTLFKKNLKCLSNEDKGLVMSIFKEKNLYFRYYDIGKSAVKLMSNTCSLGPHAFNYIQKDYLEKETYILHYACCGYNNFIKKYQILGKFENKWFGKDEISESLPFHIWSRNVVLNETDSMLFYKKNIMLEDFNGTKEFVDKDIFFRKPPLNNSSHTVPKN